MLEKEEAARVKEQGSSSLSCSDSSSKPSRHVSPLCCQHHSIESRPAEPTADVLPGAGGNLRSKWITLQRECPELEITPLHPVNPLNPIYLVELDEEEKEEPRSCQTQCENVKPSPSRGEPSRAEETQARQTQ